MSFDDERSARSEHIVEITQAAHERNVQRRSLAAVGVAVCLALAAIGITAGVVETHSKQRDAEAARAAVEGWQTLGAVSAANAQAADSQQQGAASPAVSGAPLAVPAPLPPNVVIVNVPPATGAPASLPTAEQGSTPPSPVMPTPGAASNAQPSAPSTMLGSGPMFALPRASVSGPTASTAGSVAAANNPTPALPPPAASTQVPGGAGVAAPDTPSAALPATPNAPTGAVPSPALGSNPNAG